MIGNKDFIQWFDTSDKSANTAKLNHYVRDILEKVVIPRSQYRYSVDLAVQAIHTALAHLATTGRVTYIPSQGNSKSQKMVTYYSLSFVPSGEGKDFTRDLVEKELFAKLYKAISGVVTFKAIEYNKAKSAQLLEWFEQGHDDNYGAYNKIMYNQDIKNKMMATDIGDLGLEFGEATPEAIASVRLKINNIDMGSPVLVIPEFASALNSQYIKQAFLALIELWESGNLEAKTTKYDNIRKINHVPILFNAYTDPSKIMEDEKKQKLLVDEFAGGLGRRSFVVYPDLSDFVRKEERPVSDIGDEAINSITNPILRNIKSFFNFSGNNIGSYTQEANWKKPMLEFSDEAKEMCYHFYNFCKMKSDEIDGKVTNGEKATVTGLPSKAEKLAALYAFIDGRTTIEIKDMQEAIYWCSYTAKYVSKISKIMTPTERLFNMLKARGDWVQAYEIESAGIFDNRFKLSAKIDDTVPQLSQVCSAYSYELFVGEVDGGHKLKVSKIDEPNMSKIEFSINDYDWQSNVDASGRVIYNSKTVDNWRYASFPFSRLNEMFCGDDAFIWSATQFIDGHRSDDTAIGAVDLLVFDIDNKEDGNYLPIEEAQMRYKDYEYLLYSTKSHSEDNHRYRIIFVPERRVNLSPDDYSRMMKTMREVFIPEADPACNNISRLYTNNPNGECYHNQGKRVKAHYFERGESKVTKYVGGKATSGGLVKWFLEEANNSNKGRNNTLARYAFMLADEGFGYDDVAEKVISLNDLLDSPLDSKELNSTILKSLKTKYK